MNRRSLLKILASLPIVNLVCPKVEAIGTTKNGLPTCQKIRKGDFVQITNGKFVRASDYSDPEQIGIAISDDTVMLGNQKFKINS